MISEEKPVKQPTAHSSPAHRSPAHSSTAHSSQAHSSPANQRPAKFKPPARAQALVTLGHRKEDTHGTAAGRGDKRFHPSIINGRRRPAQYLAQEDQHKTWHKKSSTKTWHKKTSTKTWHKKTSTDLGGVPSKSPAERASKTPPNEDEASKAPDEVDNNTPNDAKTAKSTVEKVKKPTIKASKITESHLSKKTAKPMTRMDP
jgi:hypothetical protein